MCGILLSVGLPHDVVLRENFSLISNINKRGPDGTATVQRQACTSVGVIVPLTFCASVLSLRGDSLVSQPLTDEASGCIFCWNGEAWKISGNEVTGSDTTEVFNGLLAASLSNHENSKTPKDKLEYLVEDHVAKYLASISGPFAFLFYDARNSALYFGRDFLGRRSLLFRKQNKSFTLSSIGVDGQDWTEVDSNGIYALHFTTEIRRLSSATLQFSCEEDNYLDKAGLKATFTSWPALGQDLKFNRSLPSPAAVHDGGCLSSVFKLEELLIRAIALRVETSNIITASKTNEIDVSSQNWQRRVFDRKGSRYAVLFSGGLDCTVLACILHNQLPLDEEIDLLNVAFENPRLGKQASSESCSPYDLCPDRITAKTSYAEICSTCPERTWRLVEINVPYETYQLNRSTVISLMSPHDTEMDLSIAIALYFAAKGEGYVTLSDNTARYPYRSTARVLFSGLGADELFGGYQRHATAFDRGGYVALLDELDLDVNRLGKRNLGRDDRVICHWGREARYPYLDEEVLRWAVEAPVWDKCDFGQQPKNLDGELCVEPGKQVLRRLALRLGLARVAYEKKRAIQFGSRTAKMERRSKGTETIQR